MGSAPDLQDPNCKMLRNFEEGKGSFLMQKPGGNHLTKSPNLTLLITLETGLCASGRTHLAEHSAVHVEFLRNEFCRSLDMMNPNSGCSTKQRAWPLQN